MKAKLLLVSLTILCTILLSTCARQQSISSTPDLIELRSLLQRAFKEENINIRISDADSLSISFINSSFNNLPKQEIGIKAWQIAKVARDNYPSRRFTTVWVSFLANERLLGVFNYTRPLGTYKFDEEQLADAMKSPVVTSPTSVVRSFYDPGRGATDVYVQNLCNRQVISVHRVPDRRLNAGGRQTPG